MIISYFLTCIFFCLEGEGDSLRWPWVWLQEREGEVTSRPEGGKINGDFIHPSQSLFFQLLANAVLFLIWGLDLGLLSLSGLQDTVYCIFVG